MAEEKTDQDKVCEWGLRLGYVEVRSEDPNYRAFTHPMIGSRVYVRKDGVSFYGDPLSKAKMEDPGGKERILQLWEENCSEERKSG